MKQDGAKLLKAAVGAMLKEHLDAYVIIGYTANGHRRMVASDFGKDPSCEDGLQIMATAAERWRENGFSRPTGGDGELSFVKD